MMSPQSYAFYFPGPAWYDAGSILNMLLFFDGVALLTPAHVRDRVLETSPQLARALLDRGELLRLDPADVIDDALANRLHEIIMVLAEQVSATAQPAWRYISWSRVGLNALEPETRHIVAELQARG